MNPLLIASMVLTALVAGCGAPMPMNTSSTAQRGATEAAPQAIACPDGVPAGTRCLRGLDSAGAHYLIAIPAQWSGTLVLHAHGGPALGAPQFERSVEDLQRWTIALRAGHAWAGSSFRQGGVAVRAAAEDTERLRGIFLQHVGKPKFTLLHGQSWGAGVAATAASMFTGTPGARPYDAVLLTSGVLGGGSQSYDFRLDLRVIYQALCHNHPRADEPQYPLAIGLPAGAKMTTAQLRSRIDECLALNKPAAQRTPEQQRKIDTITRVLKIPADSIVGHMNWATFHFQEIAQVRTGGRSPFGNANVKYVGSSDDAWLNKAVARYTADPQAASVFAADTDPDGRIPVPVLTVHGINDPTAFVELESAFRATMERAGTADHLVQVFADYSTHSYLADPLYLTAFEQIQRWAQGGPKPTPQGFAARCDAIAQGGTQRCLVQPDYRPQPLATRVAPRQ